jgi:hypothetical protein
MSKHVFIGLPAYTGQIHLATFRSLVHDYVGLIERGDSVEVFDESGNAMIADCRAVIVQKFLETKATHLVFVDTDVSWEKGALLKLVDHDEDFVGAAYPYRRDPIEYPLSWDLDTDEVWANRKGLIEVWGLPAGLMCLSRAMLEKMVAAHPELMFLTTNTESKKACGLFEPYRDGEMKYGEDYSFCNRWRDLGGKIYLDPEIKTGHIGYKTFVGHVGDWLRNR